MHAMPSLAAPYLVLNDSAQHNDIFKRRMFLDHGMSLSLITESASPTIYSKQENSSNSEVAML